MLSTCHHSSFSCSWIFRRDERVICTHLYSLLSSHFFLNILLSGLGSKCSTDITTIQVIYAMHLTASSDQFLVIILLDLSAAFDSWLLLPLWITLFFSWHPEKSANPFKAGPQTSQNISFAAFNWSKQVTKASLESRERNIDFTYECTGREGVMGSHLGRLCHRPQR